MIASSTARKVNCGTAAAWFMSSPWSGNTEARQAKGWPGASPAGAGIAGKAARGTYTRPGFARRTHVRTRPGRAARARRLPRPPQGRVRLLLHRDVGALLLLRDEGAAAAVPAEVPRLRRRRGLRPDRRSEER